MSTRSALRAALAGGVVLVALVAPAATAAPATAQPQAGVPVARKVGLPTEPQQAPVQAAGAAAVSSNSTAPDNTDEPLLSGGGRASVLWILGGVLAWAGVVVVRTRRRPVAA